MEDIGAYKQSLCHLYSLAARKINHSCRDGPINHMQVQHNDKLPQEIPRLPSAMHCGIKDVSIDLGSFTGLILIFKLESFIF